MKKATISERRERPLTPEESQFATKHFGLVRWYLVSKGLDPDEWVDAVVLRYLYAVKKWFEEPELHRYSFSTIAASSMRSAIWNERQKQRRQPQTISLQSVIPGTDSLTFEDVLAAPQDEFLAANY